MSSRTLRRLYHEKRGYALYAEGRYGEAIGEYDKAEAAAIDTDRRGRLKVQAGRALCRYSLEPVRNRAESIEETERVLSLCRESGFGDLVLIAERNLNVMKLARGTLQPYEIV